MFFKKKEEIVFGRIEEKLKSLKDGITAGNRQLEDLTEKIGRMQTAVQKHDMAMEDLLEEWIQTTETRDADQDKRVADIYCCG